MKNKRKWNTNMYNNQNGFLDHNIEFHVPIIARSTNRIYVTVFPRLSTGYPKATGNK
jgi:DNA-binding FadR family transcriptional regulator